MKAPGAPTIDLEISSCDAFPDETWHILGTQGGLHGSARRLEWKFFHPAELIAPGGGHPAHAGSILQPGHHPLAGGKLGSHPGHGRRLPGLLP
jgi:hypothetical protein